MYYSPILFSVISDLNLTQFHDCNINMEYLNSKEQIIVYCLNSMEYLNKLHLFLDLVKKPFVLITSMDDMEFPLEIDNTFMTKIKKNIYFKHWFSINKTISNNFQFTSIPYGLDYWTLSTRPYFSENVQNFQQQNTILENIAMNNSPFTQRIPKIYGNFHLHFTDDKRNGGWRRKLLHIIPRDIIDYQETYLPRSETYKNFSKYSFVLSPYGNGYDCIRTFEALCLGCIVIMKKDFLEIIYEDLPVLFVNNWEDINEDLLNKTIIEFSNKTFNYEKLKMNYWIKIVNSKFFIR